MVKGKRTSKFDYLSAVKREYENHLVDVLKEPFYQKIFDMYNEICGGKQQDKHIKNFQSEMKGVRYWDQEKVRKCCKFVYKQSNVKYLANLFKSCIISNIKLLTETSSRKKINVEYNTPELIDFLYKCFINIGKSLYLEPYLICDKDKQPGIRLKNLTGTLDLIDRAIRKTITSFLPYENILEIYLNNVDDDSDDEESDDESIHNESDIESDIESIPYEDSDVESLYSDKNDYEEEKSVEGLPQEDETEDIKEINEETINLNIDNDSMLINEVQNEGDIAEMKDNNIIIEEDIPESLKFVPMKSETMSEAEDEPEEQEKESVKVVDIGKNNGYSNPVLFNDVSDDL
jgi:hypothetical protein